jgi:hypothetical protein
MQGASRAVVGDVRRFRDRCRAWPITDGHEQLIELRSPNLATALSRGLFLRDSHVWPLLHKPFDWRSRPDVPRADQVNRALQLGLSRLVESVGRLMSMIKRQMEEDEERGWSSVGDKYVCAAHVEDEALKRLIAENAESTSCSYCNREGSEPFAAPIDDLIERIGTSIPEEWRNADDEGVGWDHGYVAEDVYDTWDLVTEELDGSLNDHELIVDVWRALPDQTWAQRDYYRLRPDLALRFGWEDFGKIVKHERRYFFSDHQPKDDEDDPDFIAPGQMLDAIGGAIRDGGLVRTLPPGELIYRVRGHAANEPPRTAKQLGAPPVSLAKTSSRMSPAGVSMFYGATDSATAERECREAAPGREAFTCGTFRLQRAARVVDLSTPPTVPSLFDPERRHLRPGLAFSVTSAGRSPRTSSATTGSILSTCRRR